WSSEPRHQQARYQQAQPQKHRHLVMLLSRYNAYALSCMMQAPCRNVMRANGQRVTAAQYVVTATSKSSPPATCSTMLSPVSSQMSTRKAKCVLVFMDKSDSTCPGPALFISHVVASCVGVIPMNSHRKRHTAAKLRS